MFRFGLFRVAEQLLGARLMADNAAELLIARTFGVKFYAPLRPSISRE